MLPGPIRIEGSRYWPIPEWLPSVLWRLFDSLFTLGLVALAVALPLAVASARQRGPWPEAGRAKALNELVYDVLFAKP